MRQKFNNTLSLLPKALIYLKINQHALIPKSDMLDHGNKTASIPLFLAYHPMNAPQ
jgi:hypothetical protein